MAMNKKEQEVFTKLQRELAEARAFSWPSYKEPQRMDPSVAGSYREPTQGWYAHFYGTINRRVSLGCFTSVSHSSSDSKKTSSQGPGRFFASEADAWRQIRIEATRCFAQALAEIDTEIARSEITK